MSAKLDVFRKQLGVPLYTYAENICASGGYHILCIGDTVFANKVSLVGSIGVVTGLLNFRETFEMVN